MKVVIVGGGMAGLYAAYRLLQYPNLQIVILEANDRIGGRVFTINNKSMTYEGGAGRFSEKHKTLFKLIKDLDMMNDIYPMKNEKSFIKDSKVVKDFKEQKYIEKLEEAASKRSISELKSKTLIFFMREVLPPSEVDDLIYAFGYQSEFEVCNAYHGIETLRDDFMESIQYFGMKGGLSKLVHKLEEVLKSSGKVQFMTKCSVNDIDPENMIIYTEQDQKIKTDYFVLCITKNKLSTFKTFLNYDNKLLSYLSVIETAPLYRVYAKFPEKPNVWFKGIPRICTNNALRHVIPINEATGLIMLSYTDGNWAKSWKQFSTKKILKKELMHHLRMLFPHIDIPDPEWIDDIYWENAVHYPKPQYQLYKQRNNGKYIVCGEMMLPTGWIEGALKSVDIGLRHLPNLAR